MVLGTRLPVDTHVHLGYEGDIANGTILESPIFVREVLMEMYGLVLAEWNGSARR